MTTNPFDYVKTINSTKKNLLRDTENDELAEKDYPKFMVNRALSYNPATILHAAAVNEYPELDNRPTYEFLLNSIRPGKRFDKWEKAVNQPDLDLLMEVYSCSRKTARQYRRLITDEEVEAMKTLVDKGGAGKPRK